MVSALDSRSKGYLFESGVVHLRFLGMEVRGPRLLLCKFFVKRRWL